MGWRELIRDIAATGPENIKKMLEVAEKLPSDETLHELIAMVNDLMPLVPKIEKLFEGGNLTKLTKLIGKMPDQKTLNRLADALPMLEKLPDSATLKSLLDKADSLTGFLESIDK